MKKTIVIGTPAYGNMINIDYFNTVINLMKCHDIQYTTIMLGNESLINRARDKILSLYYQYMSLADGLMFLDADIGFVMNRDFDLNEVLLDIINDEDSITGFPIRLKDNERYYLNTPIPNNVNEDLIEVDRIGTGCMIIPTKITEAVIKYAKTHNKYIYNNNTMSRENTLNVKNTIKEKNILVNVFNSGIVPGSNEYLSEDYVFCKLVKDLGFKIKCFTQVMTVHNGSLPLIYNKESFTNLNNQ